MHKATSHIKSSLSAVAVGVFTTRIRFLEPVAAFAGAKDDTLWHVGLRRRHEKHHILAESVIGDKVTAVQKEGSLRHP